jgi:hypothetical protein
MRRSSRPLIRRTMGGKYMSSSKRPLLRRVDENDQDDEDEEEEEVARQRRVQQQLYQQRLRDFESSFARLERELVRHEESFLATAIEQDLMDALMAAWMRLLDQDKLRTERRMLEITDRFTAAQRRWVARRQQWETGLRKYFPGGGGVAGRGRGGGSGGAATMRRARASSVVGRRRHK